MVLALLALAIVAAALLVLLTIHALHRHGPGRARRSSDRRERGMVVGDPGRERRAEQRARELLRSCVNEEEWWMYRDLGFIRVEGRATRLGGAHRLPLAPGAPRSPEAEPGLDLTGSASDPPGDPGQAAGRGPAAGRRRTDRDPARASGGAPYAYLIYPHKPIVAYVPGTRRLLSEYCVEFPDLSTAVSGGRLPDSDDVLAKWMALTGDEERLIRNANMHLPGRQVDPARVRRDLWRLAEWERRRRTSAKAPRA